MKVFLESVELDAEISEQKASTSEDVLERQNSEAPKEESEQQRDFHDRKDHSSTTTSSIESEVCLLII